MSDFEIRPQEIYLLERYSSPEYFREMTDAFKEMLDVAEQALEIFMSDLPYDYRDRHISSQPDIVWGEHVLPNFRSTMEALNYGYKILLEGDLSTLQYAGNVMTDFRAQGLDYWADWMDQINYRSFNEFRDKVSNLASNIDSTVFRSWPFTYLTTNYDPHYFGTLNLPESLPIYRYNPHIKISTGETVPQDGIYLPQINEVSAQLLLKGHPVGEALVGLDPYCPQYDHKEAASWMLVERIADEGGSLESFQVEILKASAGQRCMKSGHWWSPANQSRSRYFEQGDVLPKVDSDWGETIWYLEVTNKQE